MKLTVRARVVEIDRQNRSITVRGPRNRLMTKQVPPGIAQFDELKVGDTLDLTYSAALAVLIEPYGSGIRERVEWQGSNAAGVEAGRGLEVVATIERIDRATRSVTLRGAKRTVTVQAPAGLDVSKLKAGQEVRALFIEAAVIDVRRLTPQEAARQAPEHPVPVR